MVRRKFIKDSAVIGAVASIPVLASKTSGIYSTAGQRKVHKVMKAGNTMVGTLPIMRAFAGDHTDFVSPFVLFDEFGPVNILPGVDALKVEAHPHAGVIPTSYFVKGSGHHKDSLNYDFQVNTGEFMMFSSGRGAIHMEESGDALKINGGSLHGFQIWLNMPSKHKWDTPETTVWKPQNMPEIVHKDFTIKIVLGELMSMKSDVETLSPAFYYHITLKENARLDIPVDPTHNAFVYVVNGDVETGENVLLNKHEIALFERNASNVSLYSKDGGELFLLGGQPLNEVVYSYGPFVMNNEDEIRRCIMNYNKGLMGDPARVN